MTYYPGWAGLTDANSDLNALSFIIKQALASVRTIVPVKIIAVIAGSASDQYTVNVQPLINQVDGKGTPQAHGTILNVPVLNLSGGNGSVLIVPAVGDLGLMAVCDRDMSRAYTSKGVANPGSRRMHDLSDGVYLGGFGALNSTAHQIIVSNGSIAIKSSKAVTIDAPDGLTITGDVSITGKLTATGQVQGNGIHLSTHVHSGVTSGSSSTAAPVAGS